MHRYYTPMSSATLIKPRQARSQATLDRVGRSARKLLEQQHWDELKVDDLCREARSSVGAFYARFANKNALLTYLAQQAGDEFEAVVTWFCADVDQRNLPLASRLRQLVAALWRYTDRHAGVLRALIDKRRPLPFDNLKVVARLESAVSGSERCGEAVGVLLDALRARLVKNTPPGQPDMEVVKVLSAYLNHR